MKQWAAILLTLVAAVSANAQEGEPEVTRLVLRGDAGVLEGVLVSMDAQGVRLAGDARAVHWGRVRGVEGEGASVWPGFVEVADQLWRGLARVGRGDIEGAEPLLDELFVAYRDGTGATTRAVAEGLLVCRLGRNAHAAAVEPWVTAVRADPGPLANAASLGEVVAGVEGGGRLIPALAPIWTDTPATRALVVSLSARSDTPAMADRLAGLYRFAAAHRCGLETGARPIWSPGDDDPDLRLVGGVVFAQAGSVAERVTARADLRAMIEEGLPRWAEAWSRVAIGRSLLEEPDRESRLLGIAALLRVPAELREAHPYLAGLALHEAASAVRALGMPDGAAGLEREFRRTFPGHPGSSGRVPGGASGGEDEQEGTG